VVAEVEFQAKGRGQRFEDTTACGNDFAADAVTGDEAWKVCVRTRGGSIGIRKAVYRIQIFENGFKGIFTYPERACGHCEAVIQAQELSRNGIFGVAACAEDRMVGALRV
jgi:hypothetical protein